MDRIDGLYRWLASEPDPEVDEILGAGLAGAEPAWTTRIVETLFRRRRESSWRALVANYDRLNLEQRKHVYAHPAYVRAGAAAALQTPTGNARQNALALLTERPDPALLYALTDTLRDPRPEVRTAAGRAIRAAAVAVLQEYEVLGPGVPPAAELSTRRAELLRGLREALRTFDVHCQGAVLEAGLWFAPELSAALWTAIGARHTQAASLLLQQLGEWNHPRLAGFLLAALGRPEWRPVAQRVLDTWHTVDQLSALLRHTYMLADPDVARALRTLKQPRWFNAVGPGLTGLPADVRAQFPIWVCHLDFSPEQRLRCLELWQALPMPEVQRAAVYVLATLRGPGPIRILMGTATRSSRMTQFARWYLFGQRLLADAKQAGQQVGVPQADGTTDGALV